MEIGSPEYYEYIKKVAVKVRPGRAEGATVDGSICASGFSKGLSSTYAARNYGRERRAEQRRGAKTRKLRAKKTYEKMKAEGISRGVTKKQRKFAEKVGISLPEKIDQVQFYELMKAELPKARRRKRSKRIDR